MLDAALIKECADPSLKQAIIEQFVQAVGSVDPLAITVKSGDRLILVPKPKTPEEAIAIVHDNVADAVVRVGLTQVPAGIGAKDVSELNVELFEPCFNLRLGTATFARVLRIVAKWYGNPTGEEVFPQMFDDAVDAWRTGKFEGESVFRAQDPRGAFVQGLPSRPEQDGSSAAITRWDAAKGADEPNSAGIRIDLMRIQGR